MMHSKPQKEHAWLEKLVGDWTYESECVMGPDQPVERFKGRERVHMLGGYWMVADGQGEMPGGGTAKMVMTIGYDPSQKRYLGTWIGSMMPLMFIYDGKMDKAGKVLTLSTEGPNFTAQGKMAKFQDIIEIKSANHRTLTSRMLGENGKWTQFMKADYKRKK